MALTCSHLVEASERFWAGVEIGGADECWPWKRSTFHFGYGQFKVAGKNLKTHRVAYFLHNGEWPEPTGRHTCDNPGCCNPSHIIPGTQVQNVEDRDDRGRTARKLTDGEVEEIRIRYAAGGIRQQDLADEYGVHNAFVSRLVNGKRREVSGSSHV